MSLRTLAVVALLALAALAGAAAGLYAWAYGQGRDAGMADVQLLWDSAKATAEEQAARVRDDGRLQAKAFAEAVRKLETANAGTTKLLNDALRTKVDCPKSGEVGDIVLPADLVRGMFNSAVPGNTP